MRKIKLFQIIYASQQEVVMIVTFTRKSTLLCSWTEKGMIIVYLYYELRYIIIYTHREKVPRRNEI